MAKRWPSNLYLVGGAVRDLLLGKLSKDQDLCSALTPNEVLALCFFLSLGWRKASCDGIKCQITNKEHLVVTIWVDGVPYEHTTFRSELPGDGVRAGAVAKASSINEDANRRDLTINSLYLNCLTGEILDPTGKGLEDLEHKVLRLVSSKQYGDAYQRLWEHGGRLFRLARFAASTSLGYGWQIEASSMEAARRFAPVVFERGKRESFREEWAKAHYSWDYLAILDSMGFLKAHGLALPQHLKGQPWHSLWVSSGKPPLPAFQSQWKLTRDELDIIKDLDVGSSIQHEYQWVTTRFKKLSPIAIAEFYGQSFRSLDIPSQGAIANEIGSGPMVKEEWIKRVQLIYSL